MSDFCGMCRAPVDYNGELTKLDIQVWNLNRADGEKRTLCRDCGVKLRAFLGEAPGCDHDWRLVETGYVRTWRTELDEKSKTITAYIGGSEDFGDQGAGDDHLECSVCLEAKPVPEGWEVDFR